MDDLRTAATNAHNAPDRGAFFNHANYALRLARDIVRQGPQQRYGAIDDILVLIDGCNKHGYESLAREAAHVYNRLTRDTYGVGMKKREVIAGRIVVSHLENLAA